MEKEEKENAVAWKDNKKEVEHKVEEEKQEEKQEKKEEEQDSKEGGDDREDVAEVKVPPRSGGISKRLIYSSVAGGGFIVVLVLAIYISKEVRRSEELIQKQPRCSDNSPMCPEDWIKAFKKCYYISVDHKSWHESQKTCVKFGANLSIFKSQEEMEFLMKRIGSSQYWFGLINDVGNSLWKWTDGTLPPEWLLIEGAGCARLSYDGISSDSCMSSRNYICSKEDRCN